MKEFELSPAERLAEKRAFIDRMVGPGSDRPDPAVHRVANRFLDLEELALSNDPSLSIYGSSSHVVGEINLISQMVHDGVFGEPTPDDGSGK